jgi:hypothetical protein
MKLRIKANWLRIRVSKSEVQRLAEQGWLQEAISFPQGVFIYELRSSTQAKTIVGRN